MINKKTKTYKYYALFDYFTVRSAEIIIGQRRSIIIKLINSLSYLSRRVPYRQLQLSTIRYSDCPCRRRHGFIVLVVRTRTSRVIRVFFYRRLRFTYYYFSVSSHCRRRRPLPTSSTGVFDLSARLIRRRKTEHLPPECSFSTIRHPL